MQPIKLASLAATLILAASPALADKGSAAKSRDGNTLVEAPHTRVETKSNPTRVDVAAPYTKVQVDKAERVVRIRVPYFSGDIRY